MGVKTPTKPVEDKPLEGTAKGRVARTKGVSLLPAEYEDASTVEQLTGVGFSEVYRRIFAPQMRAAADLLREAQEAGMELERGVLRDTRVAVPSRVFPTRMPWPPPCVRDQ